MINIVGQPGERESPRHAEVSGDHLLLANDCLNEVLNGFYSPGLEQQLGVPPQQAEQLLTRVNDALVSQAVSIVLDVCNLVVIGHAVRLTISELEEEFQTRTGFAVRQARLLDADIQAAITELEKQGKTGTSLDRSEPQN
jgi:hypothetical protein